MRTTEPTNGLLTGAVHPALTKLLPYQKIVITLCLIAIYLFGFFLRYEDYLGWQEMLPDFQYQDQYQMTNFDSYYYLLAARDLQRGTYDPIDEKRAIPYGSPRPLVPPLSSWLANQLSQLSGLPIPTIAIFFPVVFAPLLAWTLYWVARSLGLNRASSLLAAFLSITCYAYVYRSRIGVFDTDCLNVTFLYLNTLLATKTISDQGKWHFGYTGLFILSVLLYTLWWNTAILIACGASVTPLFLTVLFKLQGQARIKALMALGLAALPIGILYFDSLMAILMGVFFSKLGTFPLLDNISELNTNTLAEFSHDTFGNAIITFAAIIGLFIMIAVNYKKAIYYIVPFALGFSALYLGNRFLIFAAPVLALGAAYLVHLLWSQPLEPFKTAALVIFLLIGGVVTLSNYPRITYKLNIPAVYNNKHLLDVLNIATAKDSNIWTNWSIGYQVRYYLERGTYADGGLSGGGETLYYLSLPFATSNLHFAANFMQFYTFSDIRRLYQHFANEYEALDFLKLALANPPEKTRNIIEIAIKKGTITAHDELTTTEDWLHFLYPKPDKPIYFFLHSYMLKTVSWFKQGHIDLKKKETVGLPLYIEFPNMKREGAFLISDELVVNLEKGMTKHRNGKLQSMSYISLCENNQCRDQYFDNNNQKISRMKVNKMDSRFVFFWMKQYQLGLGLSKEMADTAFIKLYYKGEKSNYFKLINQNIPSYQLWEVKGDRYDG